MNIIVYAYLGVINLITFIMYGLDKRKARLHLWRIPERTLLGLAVIGGSIGAYLGMKFFHHKTKHPAFSVGVPVIIAVQVIIAVLLVKAHLSSGL